MAPVRRGETQFVAVRLGFWTDARVVLGLARELKCSAGEAGSYVLRWEEFVLSVGDALTGRVKGYTLEHLAVAVGWPGKPRKLADALVRAGVLKTQRSILLHPYWLETRTGIYALGRREDADRQQLVRDHARGKHEGGAAEGCPKCGRSTNGHPTEGGPSMDGFRTSESKEERTSADTPPSPPQGGDLKGSARWGWLLEHAPNPQNEKACREILAKLSDEEWVWVQHAYGWLDPSRGPLMPKKKKVLGWPTDNFLRRGAYLQFRPQTPKKPRHENGAAKPAIKLVQMEDTPQAREERERAILAGMVLDQTRTYAQKKKAIEAFNQRYPENPIPLPPEPS